MNARVDIDRDPKFKLAHSLSSDDLREAVSDFLMKKRLHPVLDGKVLFEIGADGDVIAKIFTSVK